MSRLPPFSGPGRSEIHSPPSEHVAHAKVTVASRVGFPHAIFAPQHYEPNYAYPLLVWLHGTGADESQLRRVMPWIDMRNYIAVAPRAPGPDVSGDGYTWQLHDRATRQAAQLVAECVEELQARFHVAADRVFLAGFQAGGELALRIALQYPLRFAGAISLGGPFPRSGNPLGHLNAARALPILIVQGRDSQAYPLDQVCDDLRLFHAAGMCVTLRQYTCGDELHVQMLRDINIWLMEQVTGQELFETNLVSPDSLEAE